MIYLGADHRGFELKEKIKKWLERMGVEFRDLGAYEFEPEDDYPLFAARVAEAVGGDESALGILLCGSGVGVDVAANKFDGIRASVGKNAKQVAAGRRDDNMNVLVIASDFTSWEDTKKMIKAFVGTEFDFEERHRRRLDQIKKIEETN